MEHAGIITSAIHSPGSVAVANLNKDFLLSPAKEEFWKLTVHNFILNRAINKKSDISILDVGCGTGEYSYDLVDQSLMRGLDTSVWLSDLIPINLHVSSKKIVSLSKLQPGKVHVGLLLGDIKETKFETKFDLILLLEVIHWESPESAQLIFNKLSQHMNPGGELIVSYCTPLNNACISDRLGDLNIRKSKPQTPIYKFTRYGSWMSFYDARCVKDMGIQADLSPYAHEQLDNPYFPTRIGKLQYPFYRNSTSTENEMMAFRKL